MYKYDVTKTFKILCLNSDKHMTRTWPVCLAALKTERFLQLAASPACKCTPEDKEVTSQEAAVW